MIDLGAWLLEAGQRRREPGVWDCCTMPAQWAIDNGLPGPMAAWRGTYGTENDAQDLIEAGGGLLALFERELAGAGLTRRQGDARPGDIGVLRILDQEAGAIFTGKRWCVVAERGLAFASVEPDAVLAVWCLHG